MTTIIKRKPKHNNCKLLNRSGTKESLQILSIPKMRESIIKGLGTPVNKCGRKLPW